LEVLEKNFGGQNSMLWRGLAVGVNIKKSSKLNLLPHISKAKRFRIENFIQGEWSGVNNGVSAVYDAWGYPSKTSIKDVC